MEQILEDQETTSQKNNQYLSRHPKVIAVPRAEGRRYDNTTEGNRGRREGGGDRERGKLLKWEASTKYWSSLQRELLPAMGSAVLQTARDTKALKYAH